MSTCEKCGIEFTPSDELVEVASMRVLCPTCAAARRVEKQREAAARAAASGPRPPAPARPSVATPPLPAVRPAAAPPAAAAPSARRPAETRPAGVRPAADAGQPASAPAARAAAAGARRPEAAAPRPAASARRRDDHEGPAHPAQRQVHAHHAVKTDKSVIFGWVAAAIFIVGASVVVIKVKLTKDAKHAAEVVHAEKVKGVHDKLMAFDAMQPVSAAELIAFAESSKAVWEREPSCDDVSSRLAIARNTLETDRQRIEMRLRMDEVENALGKPEDRTSDELVDIRRRIDDLEPRSNIVGNEFAARVAAARKSLDRVFADKLIEEAQEVGDSLEGRRAALRRYARAEDELRKFFEKAITAEDKEGETFFRERFRQTLRESDALCAQTFTADIIKDTPARDLLDQASVEQWNASKLEGFRHEISNGTLHVWGPASGAGALGILSIGDRDQWRDWVLDLEFTLKQGDPQVYLRLGAQANTTVESFVLSPALHAGVRVGERISAQFSLIGSQLSLAFPQSGNAPETKEVAWTKIRKGAIGIVVPEDTELVIHRMRIRVLR